MTRLHADEVELDEALARVLLRARMPEWGDLPLVRLASAGTDNAMFRLGAEMLLRLPRTPGAARGLRREAEWMPRLAHLPFVHPPLAVGEPAGGYPFPFAVLPWVPGIDAWTAPPADEGRLARDLGGFVAGLRALPFAGPGCGGRGSNRGIPLAAWDHDVRSAVARAADEVDAWACLSAWEACLAAPTHEGPPLWFHGDLQPFNLIVREGRLAAVIDWGALGTGDPACDLAPAWQVLGDLKARAAFREAAGADDAIWVRGKGWALGKALEAIPYYRETNPAFADFARRTLARVLADP